MPYTLNNVYITSTGSYLPGPAINNEQMEDILGLVNDQPSQYKDSILRSNGIEHRHYALNNQGQPTHLNEELAVNAIIAALKRGQDQKEELQMIAAGTTMPDILAPGFASMIQGRLGGNPLDILSCAGICGAGAAAMKAASNTIRIGQHQKVVSVASERPSSFMRGSRFAQESQLAPTREDAEEGFQYFNADFLRWMLSDGAGAVIMENTPSKINLSLRLDWMETFSYANELDTCMYLGTDQTTNMQVNHSWLWEESIAAAEAKGKLLLRQDVRLLADNIVPITVDAAKTLKQRGMLNNEAIDHYLPHISSYFFIDKLHNSMQEQGIGIDKDKWFTNLKHKGNTGSASIYIMLDDALRQGLFQPNEKILLMIPESGRFSVSYAQLTAIAPQ